MKKTEDVFLNQLKKGHEQGYHDLFSNYYAPLCRMPDFYVGNAFITENLVEDLISHLWEQRSFLEINTSLRGYLFTAVRNRCREYLKKSNKIHESSFSIFNHNAYDFTFPIFDSSSVASLIGQDKN